MDQMDGETNFVHHRLYRQHAMPWGPIFIKSLSKLGRHPDKMMIIDNVPENFMLDPRNGLHISSWYQDPHDHALLNLIPLLQDLSTKYESVSMILDEYKEQIPIWSGV